MNIVNMKTVTTFAGALLIAGSATASTSSFNLGESGFDWDSSEISLNAPQQTNLSSFDLQGSGYDWDSSAISAVTQTKVAELLSNGCFDEAFSLSP